MPRPYKNRCVNGRPVAVIYKPAGIPVAGLQWIQLNLDEFECIRLIDHLGLEQEETAEQIGVSRPTVTRIYASARKKIANALVQGLALRIEGGPIVQLSELCAGLSCQRWYQHENQSIENKSRSDKMKIVICAQANSPQAAIDNRFGRTAFWAIYDEQTRQYEFIANQQNMQAAQGAGIQAAQTVLDADGGILIACNVGPKAMAVLQAGGVQVFQAPSGMNVEQAIAAYQAGQLQQIQNANVEGHWV
ncbi:MAG: DUF134 domain-containing protein [Sedimentisphaerales bacterium]|nr:DUF134 domain-containing protein [Sedimentisphaerales bacterium]